MILMFEFRRFILYILLGIIFIANSLASELLIKSLENSVESCYPDILNASLQKEINENKITKEKSSFDTKLNAAASQRQGSSYNTSYQKVELEKRLYDSPISVYSGFDISSGYTPQYETAQVTSAQGREYVGFRLNLLNGFSIDKERIDLYNAVIEKDKATFEIDLAKMLIKTDAMKAYLAWAIAGTELNAYKNLLKIAEDRQISLKKQLKNGDVSEILVKENYNNILKRRLRVMNARNYFNQSSQMLSLYYRDKLCKVVIPNENLTPKHLPKSHQLPDTTTDNEINEVIRNRPEFRIIQMQLEQIKNKQKLAKTELLPKLTLSAQYNQNNSTTSTTNYFVINQNEMVAKLDFSLPLERSYGKGFKEEMMNNYQKILNEKQLLVDKLKSRTETLHFTANITAQQINVSKDELQLSKDLLVAENKRFKHGDSNFFMLNLREENVTNSYLSLIKSISEHYNALIEYNFLNGKNLHLMKSYGNSGAKL